MGAGEGGGVCEGGDYSTLISGRIAGAECG